MTPTPAERGSHRERMVRGTPRRPRCVTNPDARTSWAGPAEHDQCR
jgi:hypothetical protein